VLGKLKSGSDFGELAKLQSKDTGSAASGGDLGWADRSSFVKPFADKLFSMKAGELSDPVKTEFGYHIIKLESVQPEVVKSLAEVRAVVEDGVRAEKATEIFAEREDQLQTILQQQPNLALPALAQKIQLPVQELTNFSRGQPSPLGPSAEFDEVVFSDAVLNRRQISRPITIGEDRLMVVQVIDSQPSTFEKFESVREKVRDAATASQAAELLRNTVDKLVSDINSVDDLTSKATNVKGRFQSSRFIDRTDPSVPLKLRGSVFEANRPKAGKPVVGSVILDNGDAAVFVVTDSRNVADTLDPATRSARIRQGITLSGQATLASYVNDLRATSNVEKNVQGFQ
jgi:peptidyl-prolyl cis-trans isomerase D